MTAEGIFQTSDGLGRRFEAVPGGLRAVAAAELLADTNGRPLLEVRSGDTLAHWDGESWTTTTKKKPRLGGGIFMQNAAAVKPASGWSHLQDVDGTLWWQEGPSRRAFTSPRPALVLASAAAAGEGRVYVGTMGDGLFLFEP